MVKEGRLTGQLVAPILAAKELKEFEAPFSLADELNRKPLKSLNSFSKLNSEAHVAHYEYL